MKKFELLSEAADLSYQGKDKEAWEKVREADKLVGEDSDHVYDRLRDAVCTLLTENKKKGGAKA